MSRLETAANGALTRCGVLPTRMLALGALAAACVVWLGCASGRTAAPATVPPAAEAPAVEPPPAAQAPEDTIETQRQALASERTRSIEFDQQIVRLRAQLAASQRRFEALEAELAEAVEEVLRAKASIRGMHSRALATSRIAEVRVALGEAGARDSAGSTPGRVERERATQLLERADAELTAENYAGAVYLAEKASDLARQARLATGRSQVELPETEPIVPLMPVLTMAVKEAANMREGPGLEFGRRRLLPVGEAVSVLAGSGVWRHVERENGDRGWVHSRLLELASTSAGEASRQARALNPPRVLETIKNTNLRSGPGLAFEPITVLSRGEVVRATASLGEWLKVELANGQRGWMFATLLGDTAR